MDEEISRMCCSQTMVSYLALKRKEILTHDTTWVSLGDIMPNKIDQSEKYIH
jgi:hypothetical protein